MYDEDRLKWPEGVARKKRESAAYFAAYDAAFWKAIDSYGTIIPCSILAGFFVIVAVAVGLPFTIIAAFQGKTLKMVFGIAVMAVPSIAAVSVLLKSVIRPLAACKCAADKAGTKAQKAANGEADDEDEEDSEAVGGDDDEDGEEVIGADIIAAFYGSDD